MTNPLPRNDSLLARALVRLSNQERAREIATDISLTPKEEDKVNALVAQVLDQGQILDEKLADESAYLNDSIKESEAELDKDVDQQAHESERPTSSYGYHFEVPPEESSGLAPADIQLDDSQINAVRELARVQYGCLIGAAGTGKTTVQKFLLQELIYGVHESGHNIVTVRKLDGAQGLSIALVAFTGMAAQVIKYNQPDWMAIACKTIHGFLEFKPEESIGKNGQKTRIFLPSRHNMNKCDHDVVIIDEASMVGLDLWKQLLAALKPGTRVYMTGDLNQLPPIIGQPVFAYALSKWPVFELTKVHRQKEAGANRIVEVAHEVLNGKRPTFDSTKDNPDWRVIGFELDGNPSKAQQQILAILQQVRTRRIRTDDPDSPVVYDPYRDRVMTAGNGFDDTASSSLVQQAPLNEALSVLIMPPKEGHVRYVIDAGRRQPKFGVGLRVMATKNEPPDRDQRVTNGMTGVIEDIYQNHKYTGDAKLFGLEADVQQEIRDRIAHIKLGKDANVMDKLDSLADADFDDVESSGFNHEDEEMDDEEASGLASHSVVVRFDNGATRTFQSKAGVESLHLAFCSTVAKCQGSQFDTAIIIVHHAQKQQLCREWLYTAITRATKRVIILYTTSGLGMAIAKQKIHGKSIAEKVEAYRRMASEGKQVSPGIRLRVNVPLSIEDYDDTQKTFEYVNRMQESGYLK